MSHWSKKLAILINRILCILMSAFEIDSWSHNSIFYLCSQDSQLVSWMTTTFSNGKSSSSALQVSFINHIVNVSSSRVFLLPSNNFLLTFFSHRVPSLSWNTRRYSLWRWILQRWDQWDISWIEIYQQWFNEPFSSSLFPERISIETSTDEICDGDVASEYWSEWRRWVIKRLTS